MNILCTIDNLTSKIEFLDFSTDSNFLLFKDTSDNSTIIDLSNMKKVPMIQVDFSAEWCSDGIKITDKVIVLDPLFFVNTRIIISIGNTTLL